MFKIHIKILSFLRLIITRDSNHIVVFSLLFLVYPFLFISGYLRPSALPTNVHVEISMNYGTGSSAPALVAVTGRTTALPSYYVTRKLSVTRRL